MSNELFETAFDNLIWLCLGDTGVIEKDQSYSKDDLEVAMKEAIRSDRYSKEYMQKHVDKWLDDAIEETIYKNEERWNEFGFTLDDIEEIVEEDSIEEKTRAQVMSFIQNI